MMADIKGIDVSYHNGTIDWRKVKQSVDFAIIRAGYGRSKADKRFIYNITEARKAGLETGVYWFIYAKDAGQAVENAKKCEECIRDYRDKITMRVWADWEYASDKRNPQTKKSRTEIVRAFCGYMKSKGYEIGIYTNADYLKNKFGSLGDYPLWLARYSSGRESYNPLMRQYTSKGRVTGISGDVDLDIYYGKWPPHKKPRGTIKMGSRGADVIYLQQRLTAKGYGVGAIDGIFGIRTLEAVKAYQAENGLKVDGIVGPETWKSLG